MLTLLLSFIILAITSVILFRSPHGRVAFWTNWHFCGLTKEAWGSVHTTIGFLFIVFSLIHLVYNIRPIKIYLSNKVQNLRIFTKEFCISVAIVLFCCIGTIYLIPPFSIILNIGENIKVSLSDQLGEPPYGHAELSSLKLFCKRVDLSIEESIESLKAAKVKFSSESESLKSIAAENNLTPQQIYDLIKPKLSGLPDDARPGLGRLTILLFCKEYSVDRDRVSKILEEKKITFTDGTTIKKIADSNNTTPSKLYSIIKENY